MFVLGVEMKRGCCCRGRICLGLLTSDERGSEGHSGL